jgi:hypothetical protein
MAGLTDRQALPRARFARPHLLLGDALCDKQTGRQTDPAGCPFRQAVPPAGRYVVRQAHPGSARLEGGHASGPRLAALRGRSRQAELPAGPAGRRNDGEAGRDACAHQRRGLRIQLGAGSSPRAAAWGVFRGRRARVSPWISASGRGQLASVQDSPQWVLDPSLRWSSAWRACLVGGGRVAHPVGLGGGNLLLLGKPSLGQFRD